MSLPIHNPVTSTFRSSRRYGQHSVTDHQGVDFKARVRTPVHTAARGKVVLAKNLLLSGNTLIIDHGFFTVYAHLKKLSVKPGAIVKAKKLIGLSGKSGRATGPPLH